MFRINLVKTGVNATNGHILPAGPKGPVSRYDGWLKLKSRIATDAAVAGLAIAVFAAFGLWGAGQGYAPDGDSVRLFDSARTILEGGYERSRSSGYPAFEAFIALILWLGGGVRAVGIAVLVMWLATATVLARLARPGNRLLVPAAFLLTPVILTNASWQMETAQAALLASVYLLFFLESRIRFRFVCMGLTGVLLMLTRIDACFAIVALAAAGLVAERDWRHAAVVVFVGAVSFGVYVGLNDGLSFLGPFEEANDSIFRYIAKSMVIVYVVMAFTGFAMVISVLLRWGQLRPLLRWAFAFMAVAWAARIIMHPEEPEYLVIPYVFLLAAFVSQPQSLRGTHLLALALVSNLFTPIFFELPDTARDSHRLTLAVGSPPVWQDIERRIAYNTALEDETVEFIRAQSGIDVVSSPFHDWLMNAQGDEIVIFSDALFVFRTQRLTSFSFVDLSQYKRIVVCEGRRIPTRGWRWLRRLGLPHVNEAMKTGKPLACRATGASRIQAR